jgi:hypothetical protein
MVSKYFTPNVVLTILGVLVVCFLLYRYRKSVEGFEDAITQVQSALNGQLPSAAQTSMISSDVAGATSSNPTTAKPQAKEVLATLESFNNFRMLVASKDPDSTDLDANLKSQAKELNSNYNNYMEMLQVALTNSDASNFTSATLSDIRNEVESATSALRAANVVSGPAKPASAKPYSRIGCYGDQPNRAIPTNEGDPALPGDYHTRDNAIDKCYEVAAQKGHKVFAVQAGGWCASSPSDDPKEYGKYGISEGCGSDGKGGTWASDVYRINPPTAAAAATIPTLDVTPTIVAGRPGLITIKELNDLHARIQQELVRIANLRSSSPTLTNRLSHLEKLTADLGDIITAVERGRMKLEDVPIKPDDAQAFLKQLPNVGVALPSLIAPEGKTDKKMMAPPVDSMLASNPALQHLIQNAQYLKWNVQLNLEFNPEIAQKGKLIDRLEEMEKRLTNLAISETPIPKELYDMYRQEMKTIQVIMNGAKNVDKAPPIDLPNTTSTRTNLPFPTADYPSSAQLTTAQGGDMGTSKGQFPNGETTPDVYIRPGFLMNDDTIARRASASAFDPSTVGGPDFKKRSLELCSQIQGAQLGDPANFGCIKNPSEVSSEYSWRGNYQMVCNRIGDTWGAWYPEMFGCPKYDPTAKFQGTMM